MSMIQAKYEGGVFRPANPVDLPEHCDVDLEVHIRATLSEGSTPEEPDSGPVSIEARIAALAARVPQAEWDRLPDDLSDQLDHYVYGSP